MSKYVLTWCTNYNGVYLSLHDEEYEGKDDDFGPSNEVESVFDKVSDTFPTYTYEWSDKFDLSITNKQERQLCEMAVDLLRPFDPDATVEFEYDGYST